MKITIRNPLEQLELIFLKMSETESSFFDLLDIKISHNVKNLLIFAGYDTFEHFSEISLKDLEQIEQYIQKRMPKMIQKNPTKLKHYFDETVDSVDEISDFNFNPGTRIMILKAIPDAILKYKLR